MKEKKENTITDTNYLALKHLDWFISDSQILFNHAGHMFRFGNDTTSKQFTDLIVATEDAIKEVEDDVKKVKEFVSQYKPLKNKETKKN